MIVYIQRDLKLQKNRRKVPRENAIKTMRKVREWKMQNTAKVLLADANEEFRALLAGAIEKTGEFTVVGSTGDGMEALRLVEEHKPDLLILDTVLLGLDGFGVLCRLPELGAPQAIVLSGFFSDRAASEALELGAAYYLTKPCQKIGRAHV